jgi:N-acetyl-gamma-glutamylphosphate reductase
LRSVTCRRLPAYTVFRSHGYSGGGKDRIREYEEKKTPAMFAPMLYKLDLNHKHLPEWLPYPA